MHQNNNFMHYFLNRVVVMVPSPPCLHPQPDPHPPHVTSGRAFYPNVLPGQFGLSAACNPMMGPISLPRLPSALFVQSHHSKASPNVLISNPFPSEATYRRRSIHILVSRLSLLFIVQYWPHYSMPCGAYK